MTVPNRPNLLQQKCNFCGSDENNELLYGAKKRLNNVVTHYYCILLASRIEQKGEDTEGLLGFMLPDILKEINRGKRLKCAYCKRTGATIGCVKPRCPKSFHLPCGVKNGSLHQFFGQYKSFCHDHRVKQKIPKKILREIKSSTATCSICFEDIESVINISTLWAPCCQKGSWFHRDCVQNLANSAGYFFKCPLCNNKDIFLKAMLDCGIYVPEQDASWEIVPNAFEELLHRHDRCDAVKCLSPRGRKIDEKNTRWELALCESCGSQGMHIACGNLKWSNPEFECADCQSMLSHRNIREKGPSKDIPTDQMDDDDLSSSDVEIMAFSPTPESDSKNLLHTIKTSPYSSQTMFSWSPGLSEGSKSPSSTTVNGDPLSNLTDKGSTVFSGTSKVHYTCRSSSLHSGSVNSLNILKTEQESTSLSLLPGSSNVTIFTSQSHMNESRPLSLASVGNRKKNHSLMRNRRTSSGSRGSSASNTSSNNTRISSNERNSRIVSGNSRNVVSISLCNERRDTTKPTDLIEIDNGKNLACPSLDNEKSLVAELVSSIIVDDEDPLHCYDDVPNTKLSMLREIISVHPPSTITKHITTFLDNALPKTLDAEIVTSNTDTSSSKPNTAGKDSQVVPSGNKTKSFSESKSFKVNNTSPRYGRPSSTESENIAAGGLDDNKKTSLSQSNNSVENETSQKMNVLSLDKERKRSTELRNFVGSSNGLNNVLLSNENISSADADNDNAFEMSLFACTSFNPIPPITKTQKARRGRAFRVNKGTRLLQSKLTEQIPQYDNGSLSPDSITTNSVPSSYDIHNLEVKPNDVEKECDKLRSTATPCQESSTITDNNESVFDTISKNPIPVQETSTSVSFVDESKFYKLKDESELAHYATGSMVHKNDTKCDRAVSTTSVQNVSISMKSAAKIHDTIEILSDSDDDDVQIVDVALVTNTGLKIKVIKVEQNNRFQIPKVGNSQTQPQPETNSEQPDSKACNIIIDTSEISIIPVAPTRYNEDPDISIIKDVRVSTRRRFGSKQILQKLAIRRKKRMARYNSLPVQTVDLSLDDQSIETNASAISQNVNQNGISPVQRNGRGQSTPTSNSIPSTSDLHRQRNQPLSVLREPQSSMSIAQQSKKHSPSRMSQNLMQTSIQQNNQQIDKHVGVFNSDPQNFTTNHGSKPTSVTKPREQSSHSRLSNLLDGVNSQNNPLLYQQTNCVSNSNNPSATNGYRKPTNLVPQRFNRIENQTLSKSVSQLLMEPKNCIKRPRFEKVNIYDSQKSQSTDQNLSTFPQPTTPQLSVDQFMPLGNMVLITNQPDVSRVLESSSDKGSQLVSVPELTNMNQKSYMVQGNMLGYPESQPSQNLLSSSFNETQYIQQIDGNCRVYQRNVMYDQATSYVTTGNTSQSFLNLQPATTYMPIVTNIPQGYTIAAAQPQLVSYVTSVPQPQPQQNYFFPLQQLMAIDNNFDSSTSQLNFQNINSTSQCASNAVVSSVSPEESIAEEPPGQAQEPKNTDNTQLTLNNQHLNLIAAFNQQSNHIANTAPILPVKKKRGRPCKEMH